MKHILPFSKSVASSVGLESIKPAAFLPAGMVVGMLAPAVDIALRVANSSASVLVTGESGTGKELISQIVHGASSRKDGPNICVNCAALPESLIESELFGHRRGSFTGADNDRAGCFEIAKSGTLLLDEISEIPVNIQAKLLRVLETGAVNRVGSNEPIQLDVRIVATSNRNLDLEVSGGRFRLDLLHRLKVIQIELPPLRDRVNDIEQLAITFVDLFANETSQPIAGFEDSAINRLKKYRWPGNVRELRNVIHRACVLATSRRISNQDLGAFDVTSTDPSAASIKIGAMTLADMEKWAILEALDRHSGCRTAAARQLGISPRTIFNKMLVYERESAPNSIRIQETGTRSGNIGPSQLRVA